MRFPARKSKTERSMEKYSYLIAWHLHFALLPIRIGNEYFWLENVWRKGERIPVGEVWRWKWEYLHNRTEIKKW